MLSLIIKKFVKNSEDIASPKVRKAYGTVCGICGIILNIILFGVKFLAGQLSGSVAITADAFNNLSDAGSSLITLFGFVLSDKKPDKNHPFGHGRMEYLSGLVVSFLIILMGYELATDSVSKLISPTETNFSLLPALILVFSIVVKLYMSLYNKKYGKKINSSAMLATSTDSLTDAISTLVVLVVSIITKLTGFVLLDGICGLIVSLIILYAGINAAKDTISPLLGKAPDEELVKGIEAVVMQNEHIHGIHDLIVHDYGPGRVFVSLHAEVSAKEDIVVIHDMIDCLEEELAEKFNCEATIHMDPLSIDDEEYKTARAAVDKAVKETVSEAKYHDLRIVKGESHTNIIFDVLVPADCRKPQSEIIDEIKKRINGYNEKYHCVIKIDTDYTGIIC